MNDPFIGTVLKQMYKIESLLADGGMSRIYLAKQISLSRTVAIKVLLPEYFDQDFIDLFLREARVNSQINHPNIVSILDFDIDPEKQCAYIAMEYLEGGNLSEIVHQQSGLSIENINWLMGQLCSAIQCAHNLSIVHRDIKPGNIMVSKVAGDNTIVKVVDFGISKPMKEDDLKHTQLGTIIGTPGYLSPEQIQGKPVDYRSDIYALGAIIHFMATGKRPYTGQNREVIMRRQLTEKPTRLDESALNDYYCHILQPVIDKALAVNPDQRYQSVDALWRDYCDCVEEYLPSSSSTSSLNQHNLFYPSDSLAASGYRLVFQGEVDSTSDVLKVQRKISDKLGYSDNQMMSLFSGKRIIIGQNDSLEEIKSTQKTFENLGAVTKIEAIPSQQSEHSSDDYKSPLDASFISRIDSSHASLSGVFKSKPINLDEFQHTSPSAQNTQGGQTDGNGAKTSLIDSIKENTESYITGVSLPSPDVNNSFQTGKIEPQQAIQDKVKKTKTSFRELFNDHIKPVSIAFLLMVAVISAILPFTQNIEDQYQTHFNHYTAPIGVSGDKIQFGLTGNLTNDGRTSGYALRIGIETYFNVINDQGGVNGRQLSLVAKDHLGKARKAIEQTKQLSSEYDGVFALLGHDTQLAEQAILETVRQSKIPLIAASSGSDSLRNDPPDRYVLNFKPSYSQESEALIHYFTNTLGFQADEIAVIYQLDNIGLDGLNGVNQALSSSSKREEITYLEHKDERYIIDSNLYSLIYPKKPLKALLFLCHPKAAADYIYAMKKSAGKQAVVAATSQMTSSLSLRLNAMESGMSTNLLFSQVVPMFNSYAEGVVEYRQNLQKYFPNEKPTSISLEGYLIAKMTIQALRKEGRYFTRESLVDQFKKMNEFDLGVGKIFGFSEENHQANHKVWGSRVNADGKLVAHDFKKMLPIEFNNQAAIAANSN